MNKIFLLISLLLSFWLSSFSQEVQFSPAVIPSGGGSSSSHNINLSRWRIGEIHVITLPTEDFTFKQAEIVTSVLSDDWSALVYPNPVFDLLKVRIETNSAREFRIEISDITGRKIKGEKAMIVFPGQVQELNLAGLTPAQYLLKIIPPDEGVVKLFKITKK
jgi:hypothetical protein